MREAQAALRAEADGLMRGPAPAARDAAPHKATPGAAANDGDAGKPDGPA
jgi:hypothetical protein